MEFTAGCVGGGMGIVVGQPFDTIKTRMQTRANSSKHLGMFSTAKYILQKESWRGLYKGMMSPLFGNCFLYSLLFGFESLCSTQFKEKTYVNRFISGCTAGLLQSVFAAPIELSKIRLQVQGIGQSHLSRGKYANSIKCFSQIFREEGISHGIFRGLGSNLIRDGFGFGVWFVTYDVTNNFLKYNGFTNPFMNSLLAGSNAAAVSWSLVYPVDVLKSQIQATSLRISYRQLISNAWHHNGIRSFFTGLGPCIMRAVPQHASMVLTIEVIYALVGHSPL